MHGAATPPYAYAPAAASLSEAASLLLLLLLLLLLIGPCARLAHLPSSARGLLRFPLLPPRAGAPSAPLRRRMRRCGTPRPHHHTLDICCASRGGRRCAEAAACGARPCVCVHVMKLGRLAPQDIGVTTQAFQYDPRAQLSPASQLAVAVTQPLHAINL
jgi:hypothetical protein